MKKIAPNKSLGQNFLTDKNISAKIVKLLGEISGENVIEIGPGMGALTDLLIELNANITAYDKDERSIIFLKEKYKEKTNFNVIWSDIRKVNLKNSFNNNKIYVIGNIPYNISTDILFWLFEFSDIIKKAVLTVQREVAERLVAEIRTKDYGVTTVATKLYCDAKIKFHIPPAAFFPPPKVTSSVLLLDFETSEISKNIPNEKKKRVMQLVRASFSQRRKMINNSIKQYINQNNIDIKKISEALAENNFNWLSQRAEELSVEDYIKFYDIINNNI